MILVIDNYDSFVHNLARYLRELGGATRIVRNDAIDVAGVAALAPTHIVVSPGPCTPHEAGVSVEVIRRLGAHIPILGVCLGHQCIGAAFGGQVVRARRPMHGRTSLVRHVGDGVFAGLPNPLQATRYHSLIVSPDALPETLVATAYSDEGEIMALRHREHAITGVQFHPEAVLTEHGHALLRNFLEGMPPRSTGFEPMQAARRGSEAPSDPPARGRGQSSTSDQSVFRASTCTSILTSILNPYCAP